MTLIEALIRLHYSGWPLPEETTEEWISCRCPWHQDANPSASISYRNDAFVCHACGVKGSGLSLLMKEEGIKDFKNALSRATEIVGYDYDAVSQGSQGKSGRTVFGESGSPGGSRRIPTRSRRRSFT